MDAQYPPPEVKEEISFRDILVLYIANYGWYMVGIGAVLFYIWTKIQPSYNKWQSRRDDEAYAAQYHKNPDLAHKRQEAMEAARRRMQEEHDKQAESYAEKAKQKEEHKREEWLSRQVDSGGHSLTEKKNTFRSEYNPLMGPGGSGGYRAPKRGCPGGGCGKK